MPDEFAGNPTTATFDDHRAFGVKFETVRDMIRGELFDFDPGEPIEPEQWLTFSEQGLLQVTSGAVFHDGTGELTAGAQKLAYYPNDIWVYLLAAAWRRVAQEEAFVGRAGSVGDNVGSALIAARLVRDLMRLCFLMERTYAPYAKWFGIAFLRLSCAGRCRPFSRAS